MKCPQVGERHRQATGAGAAEELKGVQLPPAELVSLQEDWEREDKCRLATIPQSVLNCPWFPLLHLLAHCSLAPVFSRILYCNTTITQLLAPWKV